MRFQNVVAPKILYPFVFSATLSRQWFLHKLAKTSGLQNRDHLVHIQTSVVRISRSFQSFPVNYIVNKLAQPYSSARCAAMVSSTATNLGVLGKWTIARKVAVLFGRPNSVGSNPARFILFLCTYKKILSH